MKYKDKKLQTKKKKTNRGARVFIGCSINTQSFNDTSPFIFNYLLKNLNYRLIMRINSLY